VQDHRVRRGIALALLTALISGVSVYVAKLGTQAVPDPFVYTAARNLVVGLGLLVGLAAGHAIRGPLPRTSGTWARLALIAVVGGSLPFLLFFWGLTLTSAPLASLIQKTQFVWVALLAGPVLGENSTRLQVVAFAALFLGALLPSPVGMASPGSGVALVLLATLLWSAETLLARRVLQQVSVAVAATARMAGGAVVLLAFLAASGRLPALLGLTTNQVLWVVVPSILLLGYVTTWYAALRRAPAAVVTSLLTLGAPVTALLASGPDPRALAPVLPSATLAIVGGALLILATHSAIKARRLGADAG
jgi:drug/metabolite transporter (DMT)-like permease